MDITVEVLQTTIESSATAQAKFDLASRHLSEQHELLSRVFSMFVGEVLPLAGIANSVMVSASGDNDKDRLNGAVYHIARRSWLDSAPATFGPDYFKVNEVKADTVLLAHPDSTNMRTGLVALLGSIRLASEAEIEEANRSRAEAVAQ